MFDYTRIFSGSAALLLLAQPVWAQLLPDNTLGAEGSAVTPIDALNDRIDGGATRGANLFHSFQEFNVGNGRGVYFANPGSINNILTRVTGNNVSEIFGTLGVLGDANLWLINPNGIHFGPNARLDVRGSFTATTAAGVWFGTEQFSATNPQAPPLLTIEPGALFSNQLANYQAQLRSEAALVTGVNLTLDAANLDLEGQLRSGGDMELLATNTVKIRDAVDAPFLAQAGGELLVQGNESVDIFALNHSESGLFSDGDMVLRSGSTVGGDARYFAGGQFRIEDLGGELGALYSPDDPVIFADEDVQLSSYSGASLHIWAGGRVFIPGDITITQPDIVDFIRENVTLSNGEVVFIDGSARPTLDIRAGVDWNQVRGAAPGNQVLGAITPAPFLGDFEPGNASADIVLRGNIRVFDAANGTGGQVFLSNQYFPIATTGRFFGGIVVSNIDAQDTLRGGEVIFDSRTQINLNGFGPNTFGHHDFGVNTSALSSPGNPFVGNGGDIMLLSQGDINLNRASLVSDGMASGAINITSNDLIRANNSSIGGWSYGSLGGQPTAGQDITLAASSILLNGSFISSRTLGAANSGNIGLNASRYIRLAGETLGLGSRILNSVGPSATGNSGDIKINAGAVGVLSGARLATSTSGIGNAGVVDITATNNIQVQGESSSGGVSLVESSVEPNSQGNSGGVKITARTLAVLAGAQLSTDTSGVGNAGLIDINATNSVRVQGESSRGNVSRAYSTVYSSGQGNSGDIQVNTGNLAVLDGAQLSTNTLGLGNAGLIDITATNTVRFQGESSQGNVSAALSTVDSIGLATGRGDSGGVKITASNLEVLDGAQLSSNTLGWGNAGLIDINATNSIRFQGESSRGDVSRALSTVGLTGRGNSGGVKITASDLEVLDGAQLTTGTLGLGNAGLIDINVTNNVRFQGESSQGDISTAFSTVNSTAQGDSGDINVTTSNLEVLDGAVFSTATLGLGNAGLIDIAATNTVRFQGESSFGASSGIYNTVGSTGRGNSKGISITTSNLAVLDGSQLLTATAGTGNAGLINITTANTTRFQGESSRGFVSAAASVVEFSGQGDSSGVTVKTRNLAVLDGAGLATSTSGIGNAGLLDVTATGTVLFQGASRQGLGSGAFSEVTLTGQGNSSGLNITSRKLEVLDGAQLSSSTFGSGNAGLIDITATNSVRFHGASNQGGLSGAFSTIQPTGQGDSRGVNITTRTLEVLDGARLSSSTFGSGDAGLIDITATNSVRLQGEDRQGVISGVFSQSIGQGNSQGINVSTDKLEVLDGARLSSSTFGSGNAGLIDITATNSVRLQGEGSQRVISGVFSQIDFTGQGNSEGINVSTDKLEVLDGAQLSSSTLGLGDAGLITINATSSARFQGFNSGVLSVVDSTGRGNSGGVNLTTENLAILDRALISTLTLGNGNADDIAINAREVRLENFSSIGTQSSSNGQAGDINLNANNLTLRNNSFISASTNNVTGGNINLDLQGLLRMRNNSVIATQAGRFGAGGNGGNINIKAAFIVSSVLENNDIFANAFGGRGGNITITANGIYGLAFRDLQFPRDVMTNDITASSDIGLNGVQVFNRLSFPAEQGLNELPDSLVDAEDILSQDFCAVQDGRIAGGTSFTVTGRGGIPLSPDDPAEADADLTPWATRPDRANSAPVVIQDRDPKQAIDYRQAQGWQVDEQGQVWLTAQVPDANTAVPVAVHPDCHDFQ
ncbi:MAG: filamentous hemagglutinin N-terminal domain-containing protein [Spirulina sp. SIO3F2]|nr:filamentous hemagglutinin N-terminal domain-containing protein [Spirulina sp. SIO3F2]